MAAERPTRGRHAKSKPPAVSVWFGASLRGWLAVLARNGFAVAPRFWLRALKITLFAVNNSAYGLAERLIYGRRVAGTEVRAPLFIVGHWRSGTTLLHEYLARDPRHSFPTTYDCFAPCHFLITGKYGPKILDRMMPDERPMDSMQLKAELPQEDDFALALLGQPSLVVMLAFPNNLPGDGALFDLKALSATQRRDWQACLKRFLQRLAFRAPGRRLVLKSPIHSARIGTILEAFPDARFLCIHRDPFAVYPSTLRMVAALHPYLALQEPAHDELERLTLANGEKIYARLAEARSGIPEGQFHELRYEDLVRDPVQVLAAAYAALDLGDFEQVRAVYETAAAEKRDYKAKTYDPPQKVRESLMKHWPEPCRRYGHLE